MVCLNAKVSLRSLWLNLLYMIHCHTVVDGADDVLYVEAAYKVDNETRGIFFFREGSVVFWNMTLPEVKSTLWTGCHL